MKTAFYLGLVSIVMLTGCLMTTKRGEYTLDVRKVEEGRAEVSGYLCASAFVKWRETRYGEEPRELVQLLVASLLPDIASTRYDISGIRFTQFEPGAHTIGWGAVITGPEDIVRRLKSKVGRRIDGDFSFVEARLLEVRGERPYP